MVVITPILASGPQPIPEASRTEKNWDARIKVQKLELLIYSFYFFFFSFFSSMLSFEKETHTPKGKKFSHVPTLSWPLIDVMSIHVDP